MMTMNKLAIVVTSSDDGMPSLVFLNKIQVVHGYESSSIIIFDDGTEHEVTENISMIDAKVHGRAL
jgi:hypothetical protein